MARDHGRRSWQTARADAPGGGLPAWRRARQIRGAGWQAWYWHRLALGGWMESTI